MYNSRVGRRTRRISDSKLSPKISDSRRVTDADDEDDAQLGDLNLTPEEVQGLLELLPYKEALIKIAKGEFEIEKVEEAEEEEETGAEPEQEEAEEEDFEEDEDFAEGNDDSDDEDYDDFEEEDEEAVGDSAVNDAWRKRLSGNSK